MQWIQDSSQSKVDNLNSLRREVSRHFRNKKGSGGEAVDALSRQVLGRTEDVTEVLGMQISGPCFEPKTLTFQE
jgi:hypothetical protein